MKQPLELHKGMLSKSIERSAKGDMQQLIISYFTAEGTIVALLCMSCNSGQLMKM